MIELREHIIATDGTHANHSKEFSSKEVLLKILKKSALPVFAIYDLKKTNKASFRYQESDRDLEILEIESK